MASAITAIFERLKGEGKKAFIPFLTAGDPDLETTVGLALELERCGSQIIEIGIPFSDPLADGPTIQRASERALRHRHRLEDYLAAARAIRAASEVPLVLFSYFNPLLQFGLEAFARSAAAAGIDGVLVTDLTPEEGADYCRCLERHGLDPVFLVAPTSTDERIGRILARCRGFVYLVSRTGVTGARESLSDSILPTLERIRRQSRLPVAVGFGISRPEHVRAVWEVADGAVVGSAIVAEIEKHIGSGELIPRVGAFCRRLTEVSGQSLGR